jgi:IS5 family transposase
MALQPSVKPWPVFQFFDLLQTRQDSLRDDSPEASLAAGDARLGDAAVCTCAEGNYSAAASLDVRLWSTAYKTSIAAQSHGSHRFERLKQWHFQAQKTLF